MDGKLSWSSFGLTKRLLTILSLITIIAPLIALYGWYSYNDYLKSIIPGLTAMNPTTALTFILVSLSILVSLFFELKKSKLKYVYYLFGFWTLIIGFVVMIAYYVLNSSAGLDQILFGERLAGNRIAPNTGLCFLICGLGLLLLQFKSKFTYYLSQTAALFVFFIATLAVIGYSYQVLELYKVSVYIPMALNTALCFIVISFCIFFMNSRQAFAGVITEQALGGTLARVLLIPAIFIPFFIGYVDQYFYLKGNLDQGYAFSLFILADIFIFIFIIFVTAKLINKTDLEKQRIREQLEIAKANDDAILTSIGDGVIAADKDGAVIFINDTAENLLGVSLEKVMFKPLTNIVAVESEDGRNLPLDKRPTSIALNEGKKISDSYFFITSTGSKIPVSCTSTPILLRGQVVGAIEVFKDRTKEKELENLKDEFISIASHELRTPMTAINMFVEMLKGGEYGKLPETLIDPLTEIETATQRLINLVNDMLNVSRIEAGRTRITLQEFDVQPLSEEVISLLQPIAKQKKIFLKNLVISGIVQADSDKVKQILNNLIGNALKFTDKGGITVSSNEDESFIRISVEDTGIGISKDDQVKLFGKFQQMNIKDQIGRPKGTGLGLYISKQLAKKMGGDLILEKSKDGEGSTFLITLPKPGSPIALQVAEEIRKEAEEHPDQK